MTEEPTKELAVRQVDSVVIGLREWRADMQGLMEYAKVVCSVNQCTPADAMARILFGAELGIAPAASINNFHKIGSKIGPSADLMAAITKREGWSLKIERSDPPSEWCRVYATKEGEEPYDFKFTFQMAEKAGLVKDDSGWDKWPHDMLYARAASHVCRKVCSALAGVHAKEELEDEPIETTPLLGSPEPPPAQEEKLPLDLSDIAADANLYLAVELGWLGESESWVDLPPHSHNRIANGESAFREKVAEWCEAPDAQVDASSEADYEEATQEEGAR